MTEACFALDAEWRFTFVNDRCVSLLRHSQEEMLGQSIWKVFHKLLGTPMEGHYRHAMGQRVPVTFEAFSPIAERWIDVRLFPTSDGLAAFLLDIDARKRAEEQLRASEEALRASEACQRATLDRLIEGCQIIGRDWRCLYANEVVARQCRRTAGELPGLTLVDCYPGVESTPVYAAVKRCLEGSSRSERLVARIADPDGAGAVFQWSVQAVPEGAFIASLDITERSLAEESMCQSEERFRQLAENIQEVFWVADCKTQQILYISPGYETIWGRSCASLYASSRAWLEAIHPADRAPVIDGLSRQVEQGGYNVNYRIIRPDGSYRWIHDRGFPVRNSDGEVYRVVGVAMDITERKGALDKLREQASLLDNARDAILVRDLDHRITYWNKGAERLYGWAAAEVVGLKVSEVLYAELAPFENATAQVLSEGQWYGELPQVTKAGNPILVEARWTLVRDEAGQPQQILAINTDITDKKKLEQQFLRAQRLESIGTLAGGIAHDLNNILAPVMMSIDLLRLMNADPRCQNVLATIESSVKRGAEMVRQILSFARGVEGQRVMVDVAQIIRDMQRLLQDTFPKDLQLCVDAAAGTPAFVGDPTQVHQVLLNLCVNARDAMPGGGKLTVSAGTVNLDAHAALITPNAQPGTYVAFTVADNGTGMPPAVMDKMFDPFFTTKDFGHGTGLGLSTVLAIVKSHGGFVNAESKPGLGSTFTVCFPVGTPAGPEEPTTAEEPTRQGGGELILLADDEEPIRNIVRQTLESFGYRVMTAADGAEAIAIYSEYQNEVAAVLMDMMMPVVDGITAAQVLKRIKPEVKIIHASGLRSDADAGAVECFLHKPFSGRALLSALYRILHPVGEGG